MVQAGAAHRRIYPARLRRLLAGPRESGHRRARRIRTARSVRCRRDRRVLLRDQGHGRHPRPPDPQARRIERSVPLPTVIELVAAFILPLIVTAAGHSDWVLPSIVITIGPLLLWLDHLVHIPRYRVVGWTLTVGPVVLVVTMSGSSLAVTTGIAAGVILLGTAAAGFHDLAAIRAARLPGPASLGTKG